MVQPSETRAHTINTVRLAAQHGLTPRVTLMPRHRALRWVPMDEAAHASKSGVTVFMTQQAYIRVCAHSGTDLDNETGGWLAGRWCQDEFSGEHFIVIDTAIPALYTERGAAHLTFTSASQVAMHESLQRDYPGKTLLGWYHTHPHMGIFFSQWDAWIHRYFFPQPWQVALVIEPCTSIGGFFTRNADGELNSESYQGFFELTNNERSLVFWRNLRPTQNGQNGHTGGFFL